MRKLTGFFILFGLVAIIILEVVAFFWFDNATISVIATDIAKKSPIFSHTVTAVFGILIGHWFIPAEGSED